MRIKEDGKERNKKEREIDFVCRIMQRKIKKDRRRMYERRKEEKEKEREKRKEQDIRLYAE